MRDAWSSAVLVADDLADRWLAGDRRGVLDALDKLEGIDAAAVTLVLHNRLGSSRGHDLMFLIQRRLEKEEG